MEDWNRKVIDEFRANQGKVSGQFEGAPMLLLTTTGAKTGKQHTTPTMYRSESGRTFVFASKGGAPTNPDWFHNLVANPRVTVELGTEKFEAEARALDRQERDRVYDEQAKVFPQFGEYTQKTTRVIPVVELKRV